MTNIKNTPQALRHLWIAITWVIGVLLLGTISYTFVEHLSVVDALFNTVNMMTTEGNFEHPLSQAGKIITIVIVILGVSSLFYTFGSAMEFMIEGHFQRAIGKRIMDRKIASLVNHYIICGFGRVGSQISSDLAGARVPFVVIDEQEENTQECIRIGYLAITANATRNEVLQEAGVVQAKCLLAATDNDANNIYITLSARNLNSNLFIVSRANQKESEVKLKIAGANRVLSPYVIGGNRMAMLALQPDITEPV